MSAHEAQCGRVTGELLELLRRRSIEPTSLEASVRQGPDAAPAGGRVIVEHPPPGLDADIAAVLGLPLPAAFAPLRAVASSLGLGTIIGFDVHAPAIKLYVNASDASTRLRRELAGRTFAPSAPGPPHMVGINVTGARVEERKVYYQGADPRAMSEGLLPHVTEMAHAAHAAGVTVGALLSCDIDADGKASPRAFFLALRPFPDAVLEASLPVLRPWSLAETRAALPFEARFVRFISAGCSSVSPITVYFRHPSERPGHSISPVAVFKTPGAEVAVHIDPASPDRHAYSAVGPLAISYRLREGAATKAELTSLLDWIARRLEGGARDEMPPPPWVLLEGAV